ncbi:hypothetical protein JG687_00013422, partial [Phytophthora cactorum]
PYYKTFTENWDCNEDEWVSYKRGNVSHLTNNTNNRIESKWGKLKDVIKDKFTIDKLVSTLITLQEYAEEQYIADKFAFDLVSGQHELATGPNASYDVDLSNPGKACYYETVIPPMAAFPARWIVHSPVNNIADGDVEAGGLRLLSGPALPKEPAVSSAAEYQETKVLAEKIMTVMTLQSTPTYSVAHQWLEGFYEALHKGNVVEFTTQQDMSFAGISQISSVGSTRLSQTSCAGGILSSGASAFEHEATKNSLEVDDVTESVDETKAEALISQMPNGNVQNENGNDEDVTLGHQAQPEREEVTPNVTEPTPHVTKKDEKELKDRWIFAERPQINGMTKEQRNRAKPQDDRKAARIIAGKYRESKISSFAKFDNVSALLLELRYQLGTKRNRIIFCKRLILFMLQSEYKSYVETINLGTSRVPGDLLVGHQLFDFRENLWLHTTSILVSMLTLRDEYPGVGVISSSFHDFCLLQQKRRTAGGLGAGNPEYTRVIGAMNVGGLLYRQKKVRKMFDPLQSNVNYKTVKKSVRSVMEPILALKDKVHFERIEWCMQQDGSSCGVWCLAILEMLVANATWDGCIYQLLPYLRMRYLYKAIAFVEKTNPCRGLSTFRFTGESISSINFNTCCSLISVSQKSFHFSPN